MTLKFLLASAGLTCFGVGVAGIIFQQTPVIVTATVLGWIFLILLTTRK